MAMNNKEKLELENLREELRIAKSLRFTEKVIPDVLPPTLSDRLSVGFAYRGEHGDYPRVEVACSSMSFHSIGRNDRTTSQGQCRLFSTRELALRAMRNEVERHCAKKLADIDREIDKEIT